MIPSSFCPLKSLRPNDFAPSSGSSTTRCTELSMQQDHSVMRLVGLNSCLKYDVVMSCYQGGRDESVDEGGGYRGVFRCVAGAFCSMATSPVDKRSEST